MTIWSRRKALWFQLFPAIYAYFRVIGGGRGEFVHLCSPLFAYVRLDFSPRLNEREQFGNSAIIGVLDVAAPGTGALRGQAIGGGSMSQVVDFPDNVGVGVFLKAGRWDAGQD
jgi:hypothetical protein